MAGMMELADKDVKATVLSFFYKSKKMNRSENMIKWKKKKRYKKILMECMEIKNALSEIFKKMNFGGLITN